MSFGVSKELVSGDESQAALEIAKVATVTRPIWAMHKQSDEGLYDRLPEMWESVKDFAQKAWERDDVKRTLGGAAGGAGLGALASLAGGGDDLLRSMITGGLAGGGVGLGYHALRNWADDKDIIQPWNEPGVPDLYDQGMADLNKPKTPSPEEQIAEIEDIADRGERRDRNPQIAEVADVVGPVDMNLGEKLLYGGAAVGTVPAADAVGQIAHKVKNFAKTRRGMMGGSQQGFIDDLRKWLAAGGDGIDPKQHAAILDAVGKMPEKDFLKAMKNLQQFSYNPFNKLFWKIPSGPVTHAINVADGVVPALTHPTKLNFLQQMIHGTSPRPMVPVSKPLVNELTIAKLKAITKGGINPRASWTRNLLRKAPKRTGAAAIGAMAIPWLAQYLSDNYHMSPADQAKFDAYKKP